MFYSKEFQKLKEYILFQINNFMEQITNSNKEQLEQMLNLISEERVQYQNRIDALEKKISQLQEILECGQSDLKRYVEATARIENDNIARLLLKANAIELELDGIYNNSEMTKEGALRAVRTKRFEKDFKWFVDPNAYDNVTEYVRAGYRGYDPDWDCIDEKLWFLLPSHGIFLDIGANIGAFCLPLAALGWTGYAIEASCKNARILQKSIDENDFEIVLIEKAIWNKTQKLRFVQKGPQGFVENEAYPRENYETIDAICLDDYQQFENLRNIDRIDIIKIDIEGAEIEALRGMKKFLDDIKYPLIYIEINIWNLFCRGQSPRMLFDELAKLGYKPYYIYKGYLIEYDVNCFPMEPCKDYIFLKNNPSFIEKCRIINTSTPNHQEENINFVRREMENFRNWVLDYGTNPEEVRAHVAWFSLINEYPECRNDELIQELIEVIVKNLLPLNNNIFNRMIQTIEN